LPHRKESAELGRIDSEMSEMIETIPFPPFHPSLLPFSPSSSLLSKSWISTIKEKVARYYIYDGWFLCGAKPEKKLRAKVVAENEGNLGRDGPIAAAAACTASRK
jgi:hypothetical protein